MELEKILKAIGFEGSEDAKEQDVVDFVNKTFVKRSLAAEDPDIVKAATGKRVGSILSAIAQNSDGKITKSELEKMSAEDAVSHLAGTYKSQFEGFETQINKLKDDAKKGESKRIAELEVSTEKLTKLLEDEQGAKTTLQTAFDEFRQNADGQFRSYKLNDKLKTAWSEVKMTDQMEDWQRKGFEAVLSESYEFDLDDKDNLIVKNKEGHRIEDTTKAGEFLNAASVISLEAEKRGLLKKNEAQPQRSLGTVKPNGTSEKPVREIKPRIK